MLSKKCLIILLILIICFSTTISTVNAFGILKIEDLKDMNENEIKIYLKGVADGTNLGIIFMTSEVQGIGLKGTAAALEAEGKLIAKDDILEAFNIDKDFLKKYEDNRSFMEIVIEEEANELDTDSENSNEN